MKGFNLMMFFAILSMALVSCDSDGVYESRTEQNYSNCFHYVLNLRTQNVSVFASPKYVIELDYVSSEAKIEIHNVKFAEGMSEINMVLENLTWKKNSNGYKEIKEVDVIPVVNGEAMPSYVITELNAGILDRYVVKNGVEVYDPIININFTINGMFEVTAVPKSITYYGSTTVESAGGEPFNTTDPYYEIKIGEDLIAEIDIYGAKFADKMPSMDMTFSGVAVTVRSGLGYVLESESLVPTIGETPYPDYLITDLSGAANFTAGLNLSFKCMSRFAVTADLGYVQKSVSQQ